MNGKPTRFPERRDRASQGPLAAGLAAFLVGSAAPATAKGLSAASAGPKQPAKAPRSAGIGTVSRAVPPRGCRGGADPAAEPFKIVGREVGMFDAEAGIILCNGAAFERVSNRRHGVMDEFAVKRPDCKE